MTILLDSTTVKVDDVDLATGGVEIAWVGSLFDALDPQFTSVSYAGADVSETSGGSVRPTTWTVGCRITGSNMDDAWAKIHALRRRTKPGRDVTLTRYMPGGEDDALVSHLAAARRVGDTVVWTDGNPQAVVATDFTLLEPWHPATAISLDEITATGLTATDATVSVDGDIRTEKMTITFTGTAAKLTNTTNGAWINVSGAGTVDVEAFWESSIVVGFNRARPFRLESGANDLTLLSILGGAATIAYYPAYL